MIRLSARAISTRLDTTTCLPPQSDASENCCAILTWTAIARSSSVRRYRGPGRKDNGGTLAKDVPLIDVPDEDPTSRHPAQPAFPCGARSSGYLRGARASCFHGGLM